jgi:hypothetical protein
MVQGCGNDPYGFVGADLRSHPGARGGLDARLGASTIHWTNDPDRSARHAQMGDVSPSTDLSTGDRYPGGSERL